jgi:hypothetical protein
MPMRIRHPDIVSAAVLIAIGAVMYYLSLGIRGNPNVSTFSPRFFPQLAAIGLVVCGLGVLANGLMAPRRELPFLFNRGNLLVAALFCLYFFTFELIDFRVSAWALIISCMWVLGARSWVQLAVTPVATALIIFWVFYYGFQVVLPVWI